VRAVRERFGPYEPGGVSLRLHADIAPHVVASQQGGTRIEFQVAESRPVPGQALVVESWDTVNPDHRRVGVAVHCVRIAPAAPALTAGSLSEVARAS
jgi:hypothetical protein